MSVYLYHINKQTSYIFYIQIIFKLLIMRRKYMYIFSKYKRTGYWSVKYKKAIWRFLMTSSEIWIYTCPTLYLFSSISFDPTSLFIYIIYIFICTYIHHASTFCITKRHMGKHWKGTNNVYYFSILLCYGSIW